MTSEPATPSMDRIIIETAQDFIDALKRRPQFQEEVLRHLLTAEMLGIPEQVKQLQTDFLELRKDFDEHRKEFLELRKDFDEHRKEFLELRKEFDEHRKEFLELRKDFDEHRKEFLELRKEFLEHRKEFLEHARNTNGELASLRGAVRQLQGTDYENHAANYAPRRLRTILELTQPKAIATPREKAGLHEIADQAVADGLITNDEADDLLLADAAFAGVNPAGETVQVVAEASITAQAKDCDRAVRRAKIMAKATGMPAVPVVISAGAEDNLVAEREHEVTFFHIPNKD